MHLWEDQRVGECKHGITEDCPACASEEIARLRKGIQDYLDGNYVNPRKFRAGAGKCAHGQYWFEDCGECIDFHFADLLTPSTPSPADRGQPHD